MGNKFKNKDFTVDIKYFIFAYVDKCYREGTPNGAISTPKEVENFINNGGPGNKKYWRKRFKKLIDCKNLKWLGGKYVQLHGDVEKKFAWEVRSH